MTLVPGDGLARELECYVLGKGTDLEYGTLAGMRNRAQVYFSTLSERAEEKIKAGVT